MTDAFQCRQCGGKMSLDDMKGHNCPFCGVALQHHARAAEHASLVNQVFQQQLGQNPGMFGGGPPPQIGYQYGAPPPQYVEPAITQAARKSVSIALWVAVGSVVFSLLLMFGIAIVLFIV